MWTVTAHTSGHTDFTTRVVRDGSIRMRRVRARCGWVGLLLLTACRSVAPAPVGLPENCGGLTDLFAVADLMSAGDHPCHAWVAATHGRVARLGAGSTVVVSNATPFGASLLVSATHVLGSGWFGPVGTRIDATVRDASVLPGTVLVEPVDPSGYVVSGFRAPVFDFFNAPVPAPENTPGLLDILPRHDFFFAVSDGQMLDSVAGAPVPDSLTPTPIRLFDPDGRATRGPAGVGVCPGALVLLEGYPAGRFNRQLAAGVGRVLADAQADDVIDMLADAGDEEGDIPYAPEVEMIIEGEAMPGMSGGGVFDESGLLVGVIVRASDPVNGTRYIRAVRLTFAASGVSAALGALPPGDRGQAESFWDAALDDIQPPVCTEP